MTTPAAASTLAAQHCRCACCCCFADAFLLSQVLHGQDLTGKVAVVTGGNSGIGFETCRALALHGACVIMACRDMPHADAQVACIIKERESGAALTEDGFERTLTRFPNFIVSPAHAALEFVVNCLLPATSRFERR